jgi:NDP-hexose-3-ketoreductase
VRLEQQDRLTEFSLPPDDQVRNALDAFVAAALSPGDRARAEESMVAQALLVDQVRQAARVVAVPPGGQARVDRLFNQA